MVFWNVPASLCEPLRCPLPGVLQSRARKGPGHAGWQLCRRPRPTVGAPSAFREPVPQPGPSAHARGSAPARTRAMAKMPNTRRAPLPIVPATVLMALGFNRTSLERANSGGKGSTRASKGKSSATMRVGCPR